MLGPAFDDLRPFARNLDELNALDPAAGRVGDAGARGRDPPVRARGPRAAVPDLRRAAERYSAAAPRADHGRQRRSTGSATWPPTTRTAPSPPAPPDRDEGYLYWAGWLGHNGDTVFSAGDGNGFFRRIYFTVGCDQLLEIVESSTAAEQTLKEIVTGLTGPPANSSVPRL